MVLTLATSQSQPFNRPWDPVNGSLHCRHVRAGPATSETPFLSLTDWILGCLPHCFKSAYEIFLLANTSSLHACQLTTTFQADRTRLPRKAIHHTLPQPSRTSKHAVPGTQHMHAAALRGSSSKLRIEQLLDLPWPWYGQRAPTPLTGTTSTGSVGMTAAAKLRHW